MAKEIAWGRLTRTETETLTALVNSGKEVYAAPIEIEHKEQLETLGIALTMAIMKLKPKYMEVVLLYFYEGYPIKEIAKMLNLTEAAVSSRIHKAKQKLRAELEGGEDDEK